MNTFYESSLVQEVQDLRPLAALPPMIRDMQTGSAKDKVVADFWHELGLYLQFICSEFIGDLICTRIDPSGFVIEETKSRAITPDQNNEGVETHIVSADKIDQAHETLDKPPLTASGECMFVRAEMFIAPCSLVAELMIMDFLMSTMALVAPNSCHAGMQSGPRRCPGQNPLSLSPPDTALLCASFVKAVT